MKRRLDQFLVARLSRAARVLVLLAAPLLAPTFFLPLWQITMFAPQYQDGLRLEIHSSGIAAGNEGQDLAEINILNHYIGMKGLAEEDFTEFKWMPFVIGALALIILRAAFFGHVAQLVDAAALYGYFVLFSLWSFGSRMYAYGHNLSPDAPVKVQPFTPPLIGSAQLANFEVYSYPELGSYALAASGLALVAALLLTLRVSRRGGEGV